LDDDGIVQFNFIANSISKLQENRRIRLLKINRNKTKKGRINAAVYSQAKT